MKKYTEQYNKGQFFTPANLAAKMIATVPNDLWGKPVLEPACGDGNLVITLLDKMVELGMDPDVAVSLIRANELDVKTAKVCEERVKQWMTEHGCKTESFTVTTYDAAKHKFENYDWVFANPPYGHFTGGPLMQMIVKNTCSDKPAVLLVKRSLKLNNVIHIEDVDFPGICVRTVIATTYPGKGNRWNWMDEFADIMDESCKWECGKKDEANYVAILMTGSKQLLRIKRKGESRSKFLFYLKLTDQEATYLLQHSANTEREQAYMEVKDVITRRNKRILRHAINERLKTF